MNKKIHLKKFIGNHQLLIGIGLLYLFLTVPIVLSSIVVSASADGNVEVLIEGQIYGFTWEYIEVGGEDGIRVTAYTSDLPCDKIDFRYWYGTSKGTGDGDLSNKQVLTSLILGQKVAVDIQMEPNYCQDVFIEVHFHTTSNVAGSVKITNAIHVPWFDNLGLAMLPAIGILAILKKKGIISL